MPQLLPKWLRERQFSRKAVVDGPLAFDNAYSKAAAVKKASPPLSRAK